MFLEKTAVKEGIREEELEKLHAKIGQLVVERAPVDVCRAAPKADEPEHGQLSIVRQCALVSISRSSPYYQLTGETAETLALMRLIDAQFLETACYGSRQMARHLWRDGHEVGRKRVRRLMSRMGLAPIYQRPRTTVPHPSIESIATCCGIWWWTVRSRSGLPIYAYPNAAGLFCIWSH